MTEMMTMTAVRSADKKDCGCGGGSHADCCQLECLVHPRFFCGQLLADQDLTALVDWVKAKSALARYRHGWGVVCGLDIHCGKRGTITVSPGYAMDCCGRDIVVCDETPFDLSPCWQRPDDPCAGTAVVRNQAMRSEITFNNGIPASDDQFGFIPRRELQAVDIFIRYVESQSDSRTALARGGCGGAAGCEYTRVHEGFEIYCRPAEDCEVAPDQWIEWETDYVQGLLNLRRDLDRILKLEAPLDRLLEYVTRHSPHTFCFTREWLCYLQRPQDPPVPADTMGANLAEIAFWIVQDWRNEYLRKPCRGCGPETGIRLGRVWMWMRRDSRGKEDLSAVYLNAHPPFRRPLSNDEWQTPADKINLAPYVWQPVDSALQSLRRAGVATTSVQVGANITALAGQEVILADFGSGAAAEPVTVYWAPDPHCREQRRIVAFARAATAGAAMSTTTTTTTPPTPPGPATPPPPTPGVGAGRAVELTELAGIGDGIANRLRAGGINTVADLANATPETVRKALGNLRVPDTRVEEMIAQAKANVS